VRNEPQIAGIDGEEEPQIAQIGTDEGDCILGAAKGERTTDYAGAERAIDCRAWRGGSHRLRRLAQMKRLHSGSGKGSERSITQVRNRPQIAGIDGEEEPQIAQIGTDEGDCIPGAAKGVSDRLGRCETGHRIAGLGGREPQITQIGTDEGDCILGAAKGASDRFAGAKQATDCGD
jgi:hypothetical protein